MVSFSQTWVTPLLGEQGSVRRSNRVLPESRNRVRQVSALSADDEVVTTSRTPRAAESEDSETQPETAPGTSTTSGDSAQPTSGLVRQWVTELAGAARPVAGTAGTVRVPGESEIQVLTGMFPDIGRDAILGVLQRRCVTVFLTTQFSCFEPQPIPPQRARP